MLILEIQGTIIQYCANVIQLGDYHVTILHLVIIVNNVAIYCHEIPNNCTTQPACYLKTGVDQKLKIDSVVREYPTPCSSVQTLLGKYNTTSM